MTDVARPSSGEARVCAAVALGWQMAKLYHSPVPRGLAEDPRRADRLPGFSGFSAATHTKWLSEQVTVTAGSLVADPPLALIRALDDVAGRLRTPGLEPDGTLGAVFNLHCRLLEALTVTDFRLGKAYGLGRTLAETALVPAAAAAEKRQGNSANCWRPGG